MPTVLRIGKFRFHFYSDERGESPHIHVAVAQTECKFWLTPVAFAGSKGLRPADVRRAERLVRAHAEFLREKFREWHNR
jgi:hypothetical protein